MLSWRGPDHPRAGGAEWYTLRVTSGLARRGHELTWACAGGVDQVSGGVRVRRCGRGLGVYPGGARFLLRHARDFDVVVDQINVVGFFTPLYSPIPVVACIHQLAREVWRYEAGPFGRAWGPACESAMLRLYRDTPFVTVSRGTLADLRAAGWRGAGVVAYNGVDPLSAALPKERLPTLIFLGRGQARAKRLSDALATFALVRRALPTACLWVVGRGQRVRAAPPGVTFFSDVTDAVRDALLARAWLLIATSVREGWGRMVAEAATAGTTAAVYDVPGLREAAGALGGQVVPPDPEALASAVLSALALPGALHARGEAARRLAGDFTWDAAVDVWERALAEAAAPSASTSR